MNDEMRKIPPHDEDAERATLGALLLNWNALETVLDMSLRPPDFYSAANQTIYAAMLSMEQKGITCDTISLVDELRSTNLLEKAGGTAYIASLTDAVPSAANIGYYAQMVFNASLRRQLLAVSANSAKYAYDDATDVRSAIDEAQKDILELSSVGSNQNKILPFHTFANEAFAYIERQRKSGSTYPGIPSGFLDLDGLTGGFQNSTLTLIGARPSLGKTTLALNIAAHAAFNENVPVGFFSLEMPGIDLAIRLISAESKIHGGKLKKGLVSNNEMMGLTNTLSNLMKKPMFIVDVPNMKMLDLRTYARKMKKEFDIKIIFIDYIALISPEDKSKDRFLQVGEISHSLKSLARELEIPIVALTQLNREAEGNSRSQKQMPPTLANISESGTLEQDADLIIFIHRDRNEQFNREKEKENNETEVTQLDTELIVAKNRNGPVGTVHLGFNPDLTRFENKAKGQGF